MATVDELQKQHEAKLYEVLRALGGRSRESDWALVRALIHGAVHFSADRKAGELCAILHFAVLSLISGVGKPGASLDRRSWPIL